MALISPPPCRLKKAGRPPVKDNSSGIVRSSEGLSFSGSPQFVLCVCINHLTEGMNRMLMTVAEKTKLGGVTSFEKWPGYEQQFGSKRPKQVKNRG